MIDQKPEQMKPKPNKHGELSASSLIRMAHDHMWFSKDHYKRSRNAKLPSIVRVMHQAIATSHRELANILRKEAKLVRAKP